jgi:hypothetical protein
MPDSPEKAARENIDSLLTQAGWAVQDIKSTNLDAGPGVAIREFPLATGHGCADYLLYSRQSGGRHRGQKGRSHAFRGRGPVRKISVRPAG